MTLNRRLTILTCGMPRGEQLNATTQCLSQQEARGPQDVGEHELQQCMSSWNPSNSLKHQVSEVCIQGPSTILQPVENSNKTKGGVERGRELCVK